MRLCGLFFATFDEQAISFFVPIVSFEEAQPTSMCAMFEDAAVRNGEDTHARRGLSTLSTRL